MSEEIQTQNEQQNTVATVGMRFSIIGLILVITLIFGGLGIMLLFIGFILGIIGLFYKPRGKARVAICIPLVVFITFISLACYVWKSVKTPAYEFINWIQIETEQFNEEDFDKDRFNNITNEEFNNIFSSINKEDFTTLIENNTGSNIIEKGAYTIFGLLQQGFEISFEKYNAGYIPEVNNENNNIISVDVDVENNEEAEEEKAEDEPEITEEEPETAEEKAESENVEVFTQGEQNDIEQILNILE